MAARFGGVSATTSTTIAPVVTEVHSTQPPLRYGCGCRDKACKGSNCTCTLSGAGCTKDCFCSDYDPNVADLKYLEMSADDESDPEDEDARSKPTCGNKFNGYDELTGLLGIEPTMCSQSYIAKRVRSVQAEFTEIPDGTAATSTAWAPSEELFGHRKIIVWLYSKMAGIRTMNDSGQLTDHHVEAAILSRLSNPGMDLIEPTRSWRQMWDGINKLLPTCAAYAASLRRKLMIKLIMLGADVGKSFEYRFCFCRGLWLKSVEFRHCWACHECRETDSWHCGKCKQCVRSFIKQCGGCDGVSEDFGKATREAGMRRDAEERELVAEIFGLRRGA